MAEQDSNKTHAPIRATLAKVRRRLRYEGKALIHAPTGKARERLGCYFIVNLESLEITDTHRDPARLLRELEGRPERL
ncbi:MAG: hypothetical protein ACKN9W_03845 [Methylococcus sp.]